jgi:hypothetical protein
MRLPGWLNGLARGRRPARNEWEDFEHQVVGTRCIHDFGDRVNELLDEGWSPVAGTQVIHQPNNYGHGCCFVVLVRRKPS